MKMPAFQFYPADWRKDPGVQALDFHERGIWFEILCFMHESSERGVLLLNGQPMPEVALARMLGLDNQILTMAITKLLEYGVASRREADGALVNRRMVKDEHICQVRRNAGKLGGNPNLVNQKATTRDKQITTPSPSASSSTTSSSSDKSPIVPTNQEKSNLQQRAEKLFSKRITTPWNDGEIKAWKKALPVVQDATEEEWLILEWVYEQPPGKLWRRQDLVTLLNNWPGEITRAKEWKAKAKQEDLPPSLRDYNKGFE